MTTSVKAARLYQRSIIAKHADGVSTAAVSVMAGDRTTSLRSAYFAGEHLCHARDDIDGVDVWAFRPASLEIRLIAWLTELREAGERTAGSYAGFDWKQYHARGRSLAQELKAIAGSRVRVFYVKFDEERAGIYRAEELFEEGAHAIRFH